MSNNIKMYFITFVLVLSCANVSMLNVFFDDDVCPEICFDRLSKAVDDSRICQRGCRFFFLIDSVKNQSSNNTIVKCHSSCSEAYKFENLLNSCISGCDAMYKKKQLYPVYEMLDNNLVVDNVSKCLVSKNSDYKISSITAHALLDDDSLKAEYECSSIHCSSIVQLSFFCVVLVAIIICTVKVMVLMYQFKLATLKYLVEASINESSNKARVQKNASQNQHLLKCPVNA